MRWARIVAGVLFSLVGLVVLAVVGLYVAQPTSYRIARSRTIAAPAPAIMAHLSDLHAYADWHPWQSPPGAAVTLTFSPVASGVGAWIDRSDRYGGSRSTITSLAPDRIELTNVNRGGAFGDGASVQTFELHDVPGGTEVTWSLGSDLHGLARLLWPFVGLEARIAPDLESGLTRLDEASLSFSGPMPAPPRAE